MHDVWCITNKAYVHLPDEAGKGALADWTVDAVYTVLPSPQHERDPGLLRIIDHSGEASLYPASSLQPLDEGIGPAEWESGHAALTLHLDPRTKALRRAAALAAHTSMGALVRRWSEERLELQTRQEAAALSMSFGAASAVEACINAIEHGNKLDASTIVPFVSALSQLSSVTAGAEITLTAGNTSLARIVPIVVSTALRVAG